MLDTLALARSLHPGQRNSLDALCKRYSVDNTKRELHGALLDAGILVDVYLAMTGGQSALALDMSGGRGAGRAQQRRRRRRARAPGITLARDRRAIADELRQHEAMLDLIDKASGGKAVWRADELRTAPDGRRIAIERTEITDPWGRGLAFGPQRPARSLPQLHPSA